MKTIYLEKDVKEFEFNTDTKKEYSESSSKILEPVFIGNYQHMQPYITKGVGVVALRDALVGQVESLGAVLVGAGPSLDTDLPLLKQYSQDLFIIACDAALPVLTKNGIKPNIIVVTDHSDRQIKNFTNQNIEDSFTFMVSVVHPMTFNEARKANALVLWYNMYDVSSPTCRAIPEMSGRKGAFLPGVLTSSIVMQSAFWLGFKNVAFIGNDLAYKDIKKGYANDIDEDKKDYQKQNKINSEEGLVLYDDIYGEKIYTHKVFIAFRDWLNEHLEKVWPGANVYNCSQQGILHGPKIIQSTLKEFVNKYSKEGLWKECQEVLKENYILEKQLFEYVIAPIPEGE